MTLYRYIIKEHLLPFIYSLAIVVFMLLMNYAIQILDQIISRGLDPWVVLEVFVINLGWMIVLAVPMAILVSTLMAFGKMSADNEILAIKASGLNLYHLLAPVMSAAAAICVMLVLYNDLILPDANHRTANLMSDIARKKPAAFIDPGVLIRDFDHYAIYVDQADGRSGKLKGIKIFSDTPGEDPSTTIAEAGEVRQTPDGAYLQLTLVNGETHSIGSKDSSQHFVARFEKQVMFIRNVDSELRRTDSEYRGDREMSTGMLLEEVERFKKTRADYLREYHASIDSTLRTIRFLDSVAGVCTARVAAIDSLSSLQQWVAAVGGHAQQIARAMQGAVGAAERFAQRLRSQDLQISKYMVEVHKKFAIPVACIVFVIIGAPLGIMARRGGIAVGAGYSIFFFILYWAFLIEGEFLADRMIISPFSAMWSGNILIGICGIYLIQRMVRETTFISYEPLRRLWTRLRGGERQKRRIRQPLFRSVFFAPFWIVSKAAGILPAYVTRLFLGYAAGILLAIIVIFTVVDYVSNARRFYGVPLPQVALFYWYYLPWIIQMVFPIVVLLASMFAMGTLAKHSELTAMKAAGKSIRRIAFPLMALGVCFAAMSFYLGEQILPHANAKRSDLLEQMRSDGARSAAKAAPRYHRDFNRNLYYFGNKNTVYCFQEFRTRPLKTRNVWRERFDKHRLAERIQAAASEYSQETGSWTFVNATVRTFAGDSCTVAYFDTLRDSVLTVSPEQMVVRIKRPEEMSYWELSDYIDKTRRRGENVMQYLSELHFKIAYPFMNLIVILLGVSITAQAGKGGGAALFGIGLLLAFAYWIIARIGLSLGKSGNLTPLQGAWLGNAIFLLIGLILYRRTDR